jgi:hypothetical protein
MRPRRACLSVEQVPACGCDQGGRVAAMSRGPVCGDATAETRNVADCTDLDYCHKPFGGCVQGSRHRSTGSLPIARRRLRVSGPCDHRDCLPTKIQRPRVFERTDRPPFNTRKCSKGDQRYVERRAAMTVAFRCADGPSVRPGVSVAVATLPACTQRSFSFPGRADDPVYRVLGFPAGAT